MKKRRWFGLAAAGMLALSFWAAPVMAQEEGGQDARQTPAQFLYLKGNTVCRYDPAGNTRKEAFTVEDGDRSASGHYVPGGEVRDKMTLAQKSFVSSGFSPNQRYLYSFRYHDGADGKITMAVQDLALPDSPPIVFDDNGLAAYSFLEEPMMFYMAYDESAGRTVCSLYNLELRQRMPGQIVKEKDAQTGRMIRVNSTGSLALWEEMGYTENSCQLYLIDLTDMAAGKRRILSDYEIIDYISDDFQTIYYTVKDEDGGWTGCLKGLSKKRKVAEDYYSLDVIEKTGNAYWYQIGDAVSVYDFIDDDMAEADAAMRMPKAEGMEPEAYEAAMQAYEARIMREQIRWDTDVSIDGSRGNLYYFNGEESVKVAGNVLSHTQMDDGMDAYSCTIISPPLHSIKMSGITSESHAYFLARDLLYADKKAVFVTEGKVMPIPVDEGKRVQNDDEIAVDEEERLLYYIEVSPTGAEGAEDDVLKALPYTSDGFGTPVKVDQGVEGVVSSAGADVYYGKCQADDTDQIDIYSKGELVAENPFDMQFYEGYLYYLKLDGPSYKLFRHGGGKNEQIMESAHWFCPLGKDYAAVLKDGLTKGRGDLYLWGTDGTKILIDTDVSEVSGMMTTYGVEAVGWEEVYPNAEKESNGNAGR